MAFDSHEENRRQAEEEQEMTAYFMAMGGLAVGIGMLYAEYRHKRG